MYYVRSIYCFDFFLFSLSTSLVNVTGFHTEDEPEVEPVWNTQWKGKKFCSNGTNHSLVNIL